MESICCDVFENILECMAACCCCYWWVAMRYEGFSEPRSGIEKPRSSIDVVRADDRRSVKSTEDETPEQIPESNKKVKPEKGPESKPSA